MAIHEQKHCNGGGGDAEEANEAAQETSGSHRRSCDSPISTGSHSLKKEPGEQIGVFLLYTRVKVIDAQTSHLLNFNKSKRSAYFYPLVFVEIMFSFQPKFVAVDNSGKPSVKFISDLNGHLL
jgi:hypothetical protein